MKLENFSPLTISPPTSPKSSAPAQGTATPPDAQSPQVDSARHGDVIEVSPGASDPEAASGWNPAAFEEGFASPQSETQPQAKGKG
jgi:hypothetical protein